MDTPDNQSRTPRTPPPSRLGDQAPKLSGSAQSEPVTEPVPIRAVRELPGPTAALGLPEPARAEGDPVPEDFDEEGGSHVAPSRWSRLWPILVLGGLLVLGLLAALNSLFNRDPVEPVPAPSSATMAPTAPGTTGADSTAAADPSMAVPTTEAEREAGWNPPSLAPGETAQAPAVPPAEGPAATQSASTQAPMTSTPTPTLSPTPSVTAAPTTTAAPTPSNAATGSALPTEPTESSSWPAPVQESTGANATSLAGLPTPPETVYGLSLKSVEGTVMQYEGPNGKVTARWARGMDQAAIDQALGSSPVPMANWTCSATASTGDQPITCIAPALGGHVLLTSVGSAEDLTSFGYIMLNSWR